MFGVLSPLVPAGEHRQSPAAGRRHSPRHVMANNPLPGRASLASTGCAAVSAEGLPSAEEKEKRAAAPDWGFAPGIFMS